MNRHKVAAEMNKGTVFFNQSVNDRVTRNVGGSKPTWNFNAKTGKLVRRQGNGIDWYRYWKVS